MLNNRNNVKRAVLMSLLGAGLLTGAAGITMSAKALVITVHADACSDECSSTSDCAKVCHCNNPMNGTGLCKDGAGGID
jgi:hypothetical protein